MSHIVESCPLTKLNSGLSRLHSADEDAVSWLTSYGSYTHMRRRRTAVVISVIRINTEINLIFFGEALICLRLELLIECIFMCKLEDFGRLIYDFILIY